MNFKKLYEACNLDKIRICTVALRRYNSEKETRQIKRVLRKALEEEAAVELDQDLTKLKIAGRVQTKRSGCKREYQKRVITSPAEKIFQKKQKKENSAFRRKVEKMKSNISGLHFLVSRTTDLSQKRILLERLKSERQKLAEYIDNQKEKTKTLPMCLPRLNCKDNKFIPKRNIGTTIVYEREASANFTDGMDLNYEVINGQI